MAPPIFWADLAARFRAIPDSDPRNPLDADWSSAGWGKGWGHWLLRGGPSESERELFKTIARIGAVALGYPGGEDAHVFWLDRLRLDCIDFHGGGSAEERNADGTITVSETGSIRNVCEASARYCSKCEAAAFEAERRLHEADLRPTAPLTIQTQEYAEPFPSNGDGTHRRAHVDAFLSRCRRETQVKVIKRHFWMAAGHKTPRQFQYWQAGTDKLPGKRHGATRKDDRQFRLLLAMSPVQFITLLRKNGIIG